jgi:hypothetical protein
MKTIMIVLMGMSTFSANAATLLKCKPTGVDSGSSAIMQIQYDEGIDFGHPQNILGSITIKDKTTILAYSNQSDDTDGYFLLDQKTKKDYHFSRASKTSAIKVLCTEPVLHGFMFPCKINTAFKCRKVKNFE